MKLREKKDLHQKTVEELKILSSEVEGKIKTARLDHVQFKLKDTTSLRRLSDSLAWIKSILREKETVNGKST